MNGQQITLLVGKEPNSPLGIKLKTTKTLPTKCRVVEVFPSSPADVAGVRVDDLVLRIDEQETRLLSKEGMSALLHQSASKGQVCLMLMRLTSGGPQNLPASNNIEENTKKSVQFQGPGTPTPVGTPIHPPKRLPPVTIANYETGEKHTDSLFAKAAVLNPSGCTEHRCIGSQMLPKRRELKVPYTKAEKKERARDFLRQYYESKIENSSEHRDRVAAVMSEIDRRGSYELTFKELSFGCRMAWRNAPRCMNRIQWRNLVVFDQRDVRTAEEMFAAMVRHIRFCTNPENPGVLRSAITVFPEAVDEHHEYRVWNSQFIRYAGYQLPDGSVLGDPANVDFTEVCMELGWEPPKERSPFDVLPVVLQANGGSPQVFELDPKDVLEVPLTHPRHPEFDQLNLKWYAIPGVSCLMLEIGGLRFTAAPFSGWYLVTEIGARDLGDPMRYNLLEKMANIMKLDTRQDQLWKDKAMVELNAAVLHSFNTRGVTILDHHTGSESFLRFMEQEYRERGGCPADWVWIVPPISGSATPVFHQEMLMYHLNPSFEYQDDPWVKWRQAKQPSTAAKGTPKERFIKVARWAARLNRLMQEQMKKRRHCTILYATETGHSETYAKMLLKLFGHAFKCDLHCMDSYSTSKLEGEELVLVVTSTFGSGEPPSNGEEFAQKLVSMRAPKFPVRHGRISVVLNPSWGVTNRKHATPLSAIKFAVFGLGSRAYPDTFCAFAQTVDKLFAELGGERIFSLGEGDELCGQEESFRDWATRCYEAACKYYNLDQNLQPGENLLVGHKWGKDKIRLRKVESRHDPTDTVAFLKQLHNRPNLMSARLVERNQLQAQHSLRSTIKLVLDIRGYHEQFQPGDHLSVFPENSAHMVCQLLEHVNLAEIGPDDPVILEFSKGGEEGNEWQEERRFCREISVREALTKYLDITTPPNPELLKLLAMQATRPEDRLDLERLSRGEVEYEEWKYNYYPNLLDVIHWFQSLHGQIDPAFLLSQLPLLQSRYYSISSSPNLHPDEVHLTVAVVEYHVKPIPGHKDAVQQFSTSWEEKEGAKHFGVCSNWLNKIELGATVPCFFRKATSFHMPADPQTPIIMVGPGTGVAPFRSFWEERLFQIESKRLSQVDALGHSTQQKPAVNPMSATSQQILMASEGQAARSVRVTLGPGNQPNLEGLQEDCSVPVARLQRRRAMSDASEDAVRASQIMSNLAQGFGPMYLFFGCRQSAVDQIYRDDVMRAMLCGVLDEYIVALSREPGKPKVYVQHKLKENAEKLVKLLLKGAHFYVCGDASMARDVSRTILNILSNYAAMTEQEARNFMDAMKENGLYHEDIFGVTLRTAEVTDRYRNAARRTWNVLLSKSSCTADMDEELEAVQAVHPQGITKGVHKLLRRPTVTLLVNRDIPETATNTPDFPQIPLPSGRKVSQPAPYQPRMRKPLEVVQGFSQLRQS